MLQAARRGAPDLLISRAFNRSAHDCTKAGDANRERFCKWGFRFGETKHRTGASGLMRPPRSSLRCVHHGWRLEKFQPSPSSSMYSPLHMKIGPQSSSSKEYSQR